MDKTKFIEWFVGFTDGEENFMIGSDTRGKFTRFNFRFMIGLHIDDKPLLDFIQNNLGVGIVNTNKENTVSYFIISDTSVLKSVLIPIFDQFSLNTSKYLDYLSFKEALLLELPHFSKTEIRLNHINKILNLKKNMNKTRIVFDLAFKHIKITPFWLLGFIEAEGSFFLRRNT